MSFIFYAQFTCNGPLKQMIFLDLYSISWFFFHLLHAWSTFFFALKKKTRNIYSEASPVHHKYLCNNMRINECLWIIWLQSRAETLSSFTITLNWIELFCFTILFYNNTKCIPEWDGNHLLIKMKGGLQKKSASLYFSFFITCFFPTCIQYTSGTIAKL